MFFVSELVVIGVAVLMFRFDFRNPANRGVEDVLSLMGFISFVMLAVASFGLRRSDPRLARVGVVTLFGWFLVGVMTPAL